MGRKIFIWVCVVAIAAGIVGLTLLNPRFYPVKMATFMKTGRMDMAAGDYMSAQDNFLLAIHLNPGKVEAYLLLTDALIEMSRGEYRYIIREGDTLESIALSEYGTEEMANAIFERNRNIIKDRHDLPVGAAITLPLPEGNEPPNYIMDAIYFIRKGLAVRESSRLEARLIELLQLLPEPEPEPEPEPTPPPTPEPDTEPEDTEYTIDPVDPQIPPPLEPIDPVVPTDTPPGEPTGPGDETDTDSETSPGEEALG